VTSGSFPGSLEVQSRRLGRIVWAEEALAVALGGVLARTADDRLVVALADRIRDRIAAAAIGRDRLPVLREFPVEDLVTAEALPAWRALVGSLDEASASDALKGCDGLAVPALSSAYDTVVRDVAPAGAPSVRRHLRVLAAGPPSVPGSPGPDSGVTLDTLVAELLG